jgi:hypothetical protein
MAYLKNPKQFTVIDQRILMDKRLSIKDRGMLVTLLSLPDGWNFSVIGLSKILPDGITTITTSLRSLEKHGYLKRTRIKDAHGRYTDVEWNPLNEPPAVTPAAEPRTENPYVDEKPATPRTENPDVEIVDVENPPQSNTNTSNINLSLSKKESAPPPEKKRSSYNEIIAAYTSDTALQEALGDYIAMRKMKRLPLTNKMLLLLLADLDKLAADTAQKIIIVNEATMRSWTKFFPVKKDTPPSEQQPGSFDTDEFFDLALKRSYENT